MKTLKSFICFIAAGLLIFADFNLPHILHDMVLGAFAVASITFAIGAIREKNTVTESSMIRALGLLVTLPIIIINTLLICYFVGRWVYVLFVG